MKPTQAVPLLSTLAPVAAFSPPLLIAAVIGLGLFWMLMGKEDPKAQVSNVMEPSTAPPVGRIREEAPTALAAKAASKRITRQDLAVALEYGSRSLTRGEAVAALQAQGFGKTAAYKALSEEGKFSEFLDHSPDGLIDWKG